MTHYRDVLQELKRLGLKTFVTLHHFTNPRWFARGGGWVAHGSVDHFARYVQFAAQQFGEFVDFWITINEPVVYTLKSYWEGKWPPQHHSAIEVMRVVSNLAAAHRRAYRVLHAMRPDIPVGIAKHCIASLPPIHGWLFNHLFFALTPGAHDFIGVNYYRSSRDVSQHGPVSDMGWPIDPKGLTAVLLNMQRYGKPIYITENGVADAKDTRRADFIRDHLRAIEAAQAHGVDVRGYIHWSLLDNFEWADGFTPRFGLVVVDYKTMQRTIRPSAYVYKVIIDQGQDKIA